MAYLVLLEGPRLYVWTFTCPNSLADRRPPTADQLAGMELTRSTGISTEAAVLQLARVLLLSLLVLVVA